MRFYYTYVLRHKDGKLYIGFSDDLNARLKAHRYEHPGYHLFYYECYLDEKLARKREHTLKYYGSAWRALKRRIGA